MDVDTFVIKLYVMDDNFCKTIAGRPACPGPASEIIMGETVTLFLLRQWGKFDENGISTDAFTVISDKG